jgi:hypothetical protein
MATDAKHEIKLASRRAREKRARDSVEQCNVVSKGQCRDMYRNGAK